MGGVSGGIGGCRIECVLCSLGFRCSIRFLAISRVGIRV